MTTEQMIAHLMERVDILEKELLFLRRVKLFKFGLGDKSVNIDKNGLWIGKESFTEATTAPYPATSIDINGNIYPKGGVSGSFAGNGGSPSVTVTRGIITSIV